ncbi:MAG: GDSL-type esterase/lipase family protein [Oscillospiraceae bacterium]
MAYTIPENKQFISADSGAFHYVGRIDDEKPSRPVLIWPYSGAEIIFTGTSVGIVIKNIKMQEHTYLGIVIDGVMQSLTLQNDGEDELFMLADNLEEGEHTLKVYKRMAAAHYVEFCGVVVDSGAVCRAPEKKYDYKLEVYGDSVSAGEVTEAIWYEGQCDPAHHSQYDNSHFSYAASLARKLNAELHLMGQGGIALFDGTGYFCSDQLTGMLSCYDKLEYSPYKPRKDWDFSRFTPDAVIIAIGQNDHNPDPEAIKRPEYRRKWKDGYIEMLNHLRAKHKGARFVLILTILGHDRTWDDALDEIVAEIGSPDVTHFMFRRTGCGTSGHPRATEQEEMACELYEYFKKNIL